ncbi:hypothetical protein [Streptomyces sp. SP18BB07]|uniref:hypothetical protein n=1 Tax=Streptomyces sp. SP18BB07 TaxID=3002522 RepID=UPI002E759A6D|nr:hypothetical protein [Streptomyces sp. SP18BB07]MEE1764364.1 hypothetical protein [Streptomyces sp. SP18BB07]
MPSSTKAGRNLYWDIVTPRANAFCEAASQPGSNPWSVLPILLQHTREFGLHTTTHIAQLVLAAVVHEDCPANCRTPRGTVDLARLVPPTTSPLALLDAAESQRLILGTPFAEGLASAEQQAAATARARAAVQDALNAVPDGRAGRERMLERFWELRDDPRALIAVTFLTWAAVQAVSTNA